MLNLAKDGSWVGDWFNICAKILEKLLDWKNKKKKNYLLC